MGHQSGRNKVGNAHSRGNSNTVQSNKGQGNGNKFGRNGNKGKRHGNGWDNGNDNINGDGNGNGNGDGNGWDNGNGYGNGWDNGNGNSNDWNNGNSNDNGNGWNNGNGNEWANGNGNGNDNGNGNNGVGWGALKEVKEQIQQRSADSWEGVAPQQITRTIQAQPINQLRTVWQQCEGFYADAATFQTSIVCQIAVFDTNNQPFTLPRDSLALSCSRPSCQIAFEPDQPEVASAFWVRYKPNYPVSFVSENVGDPGRFADMSYISEGITTRKAWFGIDYDAAGAFESDANVAQSRLEMSVKLGDVRYVRMRQDCCATISTTIVQQADVVF
eukprot:TRINITY_DN3527_c0_g1_i1.p1 TRINITY_DN3527_c0_g1~~TRINITY_DN3527_c0_g1_i1.p1  ORF type:complete len:329 (-),score=72.09 TRINITY_DN3527_c0_g1_i1:66-1052(-)